MTKTDKVLANPKTKWAGGGAGILAVIGFIFTYVDSQVAALDKKLGDKQSTIVRYVDSRHDDVKSDLGDIKRLLERIDDRIYQLNKKGVK